MKKNAFINYIILFIIFSVNSVVSQNIFIGEPVQIVGAFNGYSTSPYNSDYRTMSYRRLSTQTGFPTDGRGQWTSTISVQNSGGDINPVNMSGGPGNGFLFISGPSNNRFQNKWTFLNTGSATLGSLNNITAFNSGQDMGINMINEGYYTFVFNDAGYTTTNSKFVVSYTTTPPVNVTRTSDSYFSGQRLINITTSAAPSQGENIYVRYRNVNDFSSTGSSLVQATGSGTNWTATIPQQACGSTIYYYIFTSNRTLTNLLIFSDPSFRTLSAIRYDDNSGLNYSYTSTPSTSAVISGSNAICSGDTTNLNVTISGGSSPYNLVLTDGTNDFNVNNYLSGTNIPVNPTSNTDYSIVSVTSSNGCVGTGNSGLAEIDIINNVFYLDADNDGFGNSSITTTACTAPIGYVSNSTDCNDSVAAINPGQSEVLYNGVDDNCNGQLDEGFQITTPMMGCGTTLASISSLISSVSSPVALITGFRFEVTRVGSFPLEVQVIDRPTQYFNLTQLPLYAYAATYSVRCMLQRNGIWLGYYGAACSYSTPAVLSPGGATAVTPSQCGITLSSISTLIATTSLAGATGYRFRVTNLRTGFQQELSRTLHFFSLVMLTQFVYGDTYKVEVAIKTTGTFSGYGEPCNVTAPPVPSLTTQCGTIIPAKNTNIVTSSLNLVTSYDFEIKNMTTLVTDNVSNNLNRFRLSMLPNYSQSTQFRVRVRVLSSGVFSDYGDACFITSPAVARTVETLDSNVFDVTASPNPFDTNFGMFLNATSTEDVTIRIYDMIGKLIEHREVKATEVITQEVGNNYPSGVYNVIVSQGTEVKILRVIKR